MTNTHINVGGHKITTNKVGQVHTVTPIAGVGGSIMYFVSNGICTIRAWNLTKTTTGRSTIATGLPRAKMECGITLFGGNVAKGFLDATEAGILSYDAFVADSIAFGVLVYPVADDWVES